MKSEAGSGAGPAGAPAQLTPSALVRLDYVAPPPDLAAYITTFYLFRCDEPVIRDIQPAATGQLHVYLAGEGRMFFPHGRTDAAHFVTLMAPLCAAAPFEVAGPFHTFGAVLAPLGWAALTGLDAAKSADRLLDAAEVFGAAAIAMGDAVAALYAARPDTDGPDLMPPVADFIRARLRPIPEDHRALLRSVTEWLGTALDPPIAELYARTAYSPRQVQRLVARYFGSSPAHLVRKYRATRVAALLGQPDVDDATVAFLTDQFYDQPHMIREIREFVGRTPKRLGDGGSPINDAVVNVRNFYQITPHVAPMPSPGGDSVAKGASDA